MSGEYTAAQRNALHVWCRQCGEYLNSIGMFRHSVVNPNRVFKWDDIDFKYYVYSPYMQAKTKNKSTEDQSSGDPSDICLALTAHFQVDHDINLPPWPSLRG